MDSKIGSLSSRPTARDGGTEWSCDNLGDLLKELERRGVISMNGGLAWTGGSAPEPSHEEWLYTILPPPVGDNHPDAIGGAERDVGRWVYSRIEKLIDAQSGPDAVELQYLAQAVEAVEEYGIEHCEGEPSPFALSPPSGGVSDAELTEADILAIVSNVDADILPTGRAEQAALTGYELGFRDGHKSGSVSVSPSVEELRALIISEGGGRFGGARAVDLAQAILSRLHEGGAAEWRPLDRAMRELYAVEINCGVSSFWDGGWTAWIGDEMNGRFAEESFEPADLNKVAPWLTETADRLRIGWQNDRRVAELRASFKIVAAPPEADRHG